MDYSKVLGQESSIEFLKKISINNRGVHAMIFEGENGMGKSTLAGIYAKSLLCSGNEKPCNYCVACKKFEHGNHLDFKFIKPNGKKSISTDDISAMLADAYLIPNESEKKVYIIETANLMTQAAQNKLLKILEEPPEYLSIILLCDNIANILPTIISRSVTIKMQRLPDKTIEKELANKGANEKTAQEIALLASGNLGYALNMLEDKRALGRQEKYIELFYELQNNKINVFSFLDKNREDIVEVFICWQKLLSDCLKIKSGVRNLRDINKINYAHKHEIDDIIDKLTCILQAESRIKGNAQYLPTVDWLLSNF